MPVDVRTQTITFFSCIAFGMAMGIIYTLFAAIRRVFTLKKTATFVIDQCFWIIGIVMFFCMLHITCGGEIKWYEFAGMFLGLILYLAGMSRFFYPVMFYIVKTVKKIIMLILKVILTPFFKIFKIFSPVFKNIKRLAQNTRKKAKNFGKNNVEKIRRLSILLKKI